jgi:PAS domain S-box-containing protein
MPFSQNIRIAIVDDDEDDFFIIQSLLNDIEGKNYIVDWYKDYDTALEKIKCGANRIYLVDYRLGHRTGLDLLTAATGAGCDDPIVLLTGKGNKAIDIEGMQKGATDYLIKSELNVEKLERCIRYSLDRSGFLKELKARENKYRNLFENSKDAVFITDDKLAFIEVNKAASLLLGFDGVSMPTQTLCSYLTDDSQRQLVAKMLETRGSLHEAEIKLQLPGEDPKICQLSLSMQQHGDEEWRVHGILHDITALKKAEIANLQSEKLMANERLVRMLAHEIRNPLNNIGLSIGNLIHIGGYNEEQESYLGILQRNTKRINEIITELLQLTKPPELSYEDCSLQEIIEESLAVVRDRIELQKMKLETSFPEAPIPFTADKSRLVIAFNNILVNAVEAMEADKGLLEVSIKPERNGYLVSIKDNGSGIPEKYVTRLFDPFFTLKKNGMGLGLSVSYSIIKSHKGNINIETQPGSGTNFMIHFEEPELADEG